MKYFSGIIDFQKKYNEIRADLHNRNNKLVLLSHYTYVNFQYKSLERENLPQSASKSKYGNFQRVYIYTCHYLIVLGSGLRWLPDLDVKFIRFKYFSFPYFRNCLKISRSKILTFKVCNCCRNITSQTSILRLRSPFAK